MIRSVLFPAVAAAALSSVLSSASFAVITVTVGSPHVVTSTIDRSLVATTGEVSTAPVQFTLPITFTSAAGDPTYRVSGVDLALTLSRTSPAGAPLIPLNTYNADSAAFAAPPSGSFGTFLFPTNPTAFLNVTGSSSGISTFSLTPSTPFTGQINLTLDKRVFDNLGRVGGFVDTINTLSTLTLNGGLNEINLASTTSTITTDTLQAAPGDANFDGQVDFDDLLILAKYYGLTSGQTYGRGDFTGDRAVNFDDLLILAKYYGTAGPIVVTPAGASAAFTADWSLAQSLVPEPTTLAAVVASAAMIVRRRR